MGSLILLYSCLCLLLLKTGRRNLSDTKRFWVFPSLEKVFSSSAQPGWLQGESLENTATTCCRALLRGFALKYLEKSVTKCFEAEGHF